jgi:hypothetical protein
MASGHGAEVFVRRILGRVARYGSTVFAAGQSGYRSCRIHDINRLQIELTDRDPSPYPLPPGEGEEKGEGAFVRQKKYAKVNQTVGQGISRNHGLYHVQPHQIRIQDQCGHLRKLQAKEDMRRLQELRPALALQGRIGSARDDQGNGPQGKEKRNRPAGTF